MLIVYANRYYEINTVKCVPFVQLGQQEKWRCMIRTLE